MNLVRFKVRFEKILFCLKNKKSWKAFLLGVAPAIENLIVLKKTKPDAVIDVGANRGQFTLVSDIVFSGIPIYSFEPIPEEAKIYKRIFSKNKNINFFECALGEEKKVSTLYLSKRADSSSMLPIGNIHTEHFSEYGVGTLDVKVEKLDDFISYFLNKSEMLLKIDVQGFELSVLKGGVQTLKLCKYVYVECSEVSRYEGQCFAKEVESFLILHGFKLKERVNEFFLDGKLLQADFLFVR